MTLLDGGVLVADGHRLVRVGLMSMINTDLAISDVAGVDDFEGVLSHLAKRPGVKVLLLDAALQGMGGMQGLRSIRLQRPDLLVVLMTWHQDRAEAFEALAAGAHGYIPKDLPPRDIVEALQTVFAGHIYVPAVICDLSLRETGFPKDDAGRAQPELTVRQREVLTHLAAGLSNKEIARVLDIAEGTVKVHITAAFRTLHVHNRVGAAAALSKMKQSAGGSQQELPGMPEAGPPRQPKGSGGSQWALSSLSFAASQIWLLESGVLNLI